MKRCKDKMVVRHDKEMQEEMEAMIQTVVYEDFTTSVYGDKTREMTCKSKAGKERQHKGCQNSLSREGMHNCHRRSDMSKTMSCTSCIIESYFEREMPPGLFTSCS